jgi:hypothetical protein
LTPVLIRLTLSARLCDVGSIAGVGEIHKISRSSTAAMIFFQENVAPAVRHYPHKHKPAHDEPVI